MKTRVPGKQQYSGITFIQNPQDQGLFVTMDLQVKHHIYVQAHSRGFRRPPSQTKCPLPCNEKSTIKMEGPVNMLLCRL